jgi:hypothetical protein
MSSVGRRVKYSEGILAIGKKYSRNNFHTLNVLENKLNEKLVKLTKNRLGSSGTG